MIDLEVRKEVLVDASPEAVFDIVGDLARHVELAGSGEIRQLRTLTPTASAFGSVVEADEQIDMGGQAMEFSAQSVVVHHAPPNSISWIAVPPFPTRRIQWWFSLVPEGTGTRVIHEVEVDLGDARDAMGGTEGYRSTRGRQVESGMERTMDNLRAMAEGLAAAR